MIISIDRPTKDTARRPVYLQIADQIRGQVTAGKLVLGDRLPPIRGLAARLGVNRDTVSLAYEHLARSGVVKATVGRGTFVCGERVAPAGRPVVAPPALSPMVERLLEFDRSRPSYATSDGAVPLHSLIPDPSLYPVDEFRRALNRALELGGSELLVYGGHRGNAALREVIAERLREHGIGAQSKDVVLCQGASQGISLAMRLYSQPGDSIAVEEPTYHNVLGVLAGLGLRATPIPMTHEGPDLEVLQRTLGRPEVKLFYTMPSFHNPMGITTSLAQRMQLLETARAVGKPIIEDAFEMDLRYDGARVSPLAALDTDGLVVHLFSFSKSLFPGVRVGSLTASGRAVDGLLALKYTTDLSGVLVLQAAVAEFVRNGAYDRHLGRLHKTLHERRDALLEALAVEMPEGTRWTRPDGGYQIWVELPVGIDTASLLRDAERAGVLFAPGHQFNHDGRPSRCMRLTIALAEPDEIRLGVERLGKLVRERVALERNVLRDTDIHL
jgi:DNA-binding transcriptional MocR family regulator